MKRKIKKRTVRNSRNKHRGKKSHWQKGVSHSVKKDFEVFAKGVQRLEEIKHELNILPVKGFENEVASIRSKLTNVSYIPEIERELIDLKAKVNGTYTMKGNLPRQFPDLRKKLHHLELELQKRKRVSFRKRISSKEKSLVNEIPNIERQIKRFSQYLEEQKNEEERKKQILSKVDPEVNFLVNDKFTMSLTDIKAELSKRIKEKETSIQKQLHDDLETRKSQFTQLYRALEKKRIRV